MAAGGRVAKKQLSPSASTASNDVRTTSRLADKNSGEVPFTTAKCTAEVSRLFLADRLRNAKKGIPLRSWPERLGGDDEVMEMRVGSTFNG